MRAPNEVLAGLAHQLILTRDVTDSATWSVTNGLLGQVLGGVLHALGLGSLNVTAGFEGMNAAKTIQITL